jgi:hypothetical protein
MCFPFPLRYLPIPLLLLSALALGWFGQKRPVERPLPVVNGPSAGSTCGAKRYCGQMTNCAEAQFYFRQCGLTRLDGDRDGVPCEEICRR